MTSSQVRCTVKRGSINSCFHRQHKLFHYEFFMKNEIKMNWIIEIEYWQLDIGLNCRSWNV